MIVRINEIDVRVSINAKRSAAFRKLLRVEHLDHRTLRTDLPDAVFDHVNIAVFADYQIIQMHTSDYWRHRSVTLQSPNAIVICICEINATLTIQINSGSDVCSSLTREAEKHRHRRNRKGTNPPRKRTCSHPASNSQSENDCEYYLLNMRRASSYFESQVRISGETTTVSPASSIQLLWLTSLSTAEYDRGCWSLS